MTTAWDYLQLKYEWRGDTHDPTSPRDHWEYEVSGRGADRYTAVLAQCRADGPGAIWAAIGDDGWELVLHVDAQRDQFSRRYEDENGNAFMAVFSQVTSGSYVFKRPRGAIS